MKRIIYVLAAVSMCQLIGISLKAQKTLISGTVRNSITQDKVSAVTIMLKNRSEATYSNDKGNFLLFVSGGLPVTLTFSSVGFEPREIKVDQNEPVNIALKPVFMLEKAVVFAPTRTPTRFLESPVSIEQINVQNIQRAAVPDFYESIANLKGVDLTTSSLTFRTVSTRGFNRSGNQRINQYMDGMDNQAPGLNFSVGNLLGMTEMDVESVELLPGASSALYGSGGLKGTLLINSKNPFKYQGFSFQVKQGVMHLGNSNHNPSPYHDLSIRFAKAYNRFAFKVNAQLIKGEDWQAADTSNLERSNLISRQKGGDRNSDPGYDGVNVYGDEININMMATTERVISQATKAFRTQFRAAYAREPNDLEVDNFMSRHPQAGVFWTAMKRKQMPDQIVSRTGFNEKDLVDHSTYNLKASGGVYYKINDKTEASLIGYWGTGTSVYTHADRYSLKGVNMGQFKAEIRNKKWFLRAYTTQENAGEAYNTTALASYINEAIKPSEQWFAEYLGTFAKARSLGQTEANAHMTARSKADSGRLVPGSAAFNEQRERIRKTPISKGGALFLDKTDLWQFDGQLDLSDKVKFMEVLVGTTYRQFLLNSEGTLFTDTSGRIRIPEWGGFVQLQKALFKDVLKISASGRYDKSRNFTGHFTPRVTALVKIADESIIRMSYQTAYRFPSTQDQYINLFTGTATLIGSLPQFGTLYNFEKNPVYTAQSISRYRESGKPSDLEKGEFNSMEPEKLSSFELGYKCLINKTLLIDVYGYLSKFNNFIGRVAVGQPRTASTFEEDLRNSVSTKNFSYVQNVNQSVNASGFGVGIEYKMIRNFTANVNASSDKIYNIPSNIISFFNTPGFRFNAGIGNDKILKQFGFNMNYRWQAKIDWEGPFGTGLVPAYGTLDAQMSYSIPGTKNMFKLGASNLMNKYYSSAFGNPQVGGLYYISFGYNVL